MRSFSLFALVLSFAHSAPQTYESEGQKFHIEEITQRPDVVWGMDFLSPNEIIGTERSGKIFVYNLRSKTTTELKGPPKVYSEGQGGMLDVSVFPFNGADKEKKIFFTYSVSKDNQATTALATATVKGNSLVNLKTIFQATAWNKNNIHFGSRIAWESPTTLFMSVGERNDRYLAQKLDNHHGKILRLTTDGRAASGNPFEKTPGALPEIWSYGHRNPQGLAFDQSKNLLEAEFGPRGGDEINLIKAGANYGWPVITYGREYWGPKIGEGTQKVGMEQPLVHWVPAISPSGMDVYSGKAFPKWTGNLFIGCLSATHLRRVVFDKQLKVARQEKLLEDKGWRIRQVRTGPDGYLYLTTDGGLLARLVPLK